MPHPQGYPVGRDVNCGSGRYKTPDPGPGGEGKVFKGRKPSSELLRRKQPLPWRQQHHARVSDVMSSRHFARLPCVVATTGFGPGIQKVFRVKRHTA